MEQSILIDSVALERSRELLCLFVSLVLALPLGERRERGGRRGGDRGITRRRDEACSRADRARDEAGGAPQRRHLDQRRFALTRGLLESTQRSKRSDILGVRFTPLDAARPPL